LAPFDAVSYTLAKKAYKQALAAITSPLTSNLDFGGYRGVNVGAPVNPTDLVRLDELPKQGLDADKPTPGIAGRLYYATDTKKLYRDDGTTWILLTFSIQIDTTDITG